MCIRDSSIFGGQPLVIVGVTGPVTILTISIYGMAKALDIDFLRFYQWAQIWAGLMHMATAAAGWCAAIKYVTNFSCHTFGLLIATIYAVTGATGIARYYTRSQSFAACLMETILALGTTLVSLYLANATNWTLFNAKVRTVISDYAPTFAIVLICVDSKPSTRLQCERIRRFRREAFCRASGNPREQSIRPKLSRDGEF